MAYKGGGSTGYFVFIALMLVVAVGTLYVFKTGMVSFADIFLPPEPDSRGFSPPGNDVGLTPSRASASKKDDKFNETMPSDRSLEVNWSAPLKKELVVTRMVEGKAAKMKLKLVPQGWFQMGENDGISRNMPKKWVWASDYYMAETETTNEQYFLFISDGGYTKGKYWYSEGQKWVLSMNRRGSGYIGWKQFDRKNFRIWNITSPDGEYSIVVNQPDTEIGQPDVTVIVQPSKHPSQSWLNINTKDGSIEVRNKATNEFGHLSARELLQRLRAEESDLLQVTNQSGRVSLSNIAERKKLSIIAYIDGDNMPPLFTSVVTAAKSKKRDPQMPVVSISWFEADAASRYWGGNLPWEFQWEKAARGEYGQFFPWGNTIEQPMKIAGSGSSRSRVNFDHTKIVNVGSFPLGVGGYGHHDLVGNVSEWCRDVYKRDMLSDDGYKKPDPFILGEMRSHHSARGSNGSGSDDDAQMARCYMRRSADPHTLTSSWRGFRVAFTAKQAYAAVGVDLPSKD